MIYKKSQKKGFTLVGVLGASFVAIIVVTALASIVSQIYGAARISKNRYIAIGLAKEGIELVRNMRDSNWLNYPSASGVIDSTIFWRGQNTDDLLACGGASCKRLRSICDGGPYAIDALQQDLRLAAAENNGILYLDAASGVYTHNSGGNTPSIFSRTITISTANPPSGELGDFAPANQSNCGFSVTFPGDGSVNGDGTTNLKPRGLIVTSTVTWTEPGTGVSKNIQLQSTLYDWLIQRP